MMSPLALSGHEGQPWQERRRNCGYGEGGVNKQVDPRTLYFALLGPFLTWLVLLVFGLSQTYPGPIFDDERWWPITFLGSYGISLLPLLLIARIDRKMAGNHWRVPVCFAVGFVLGVGLLNSVTAVGYEKLFVQAWFYFGLMWGLPAGVCSWLSSEKQNGSVDA